MRIFDACLRELTPFLQEPLLSAESTQRVVARAASLPEPLSAFYLECRLSPPSPEVDLLAMVHRSEPAVAEGPEEPPATSISDRSRDFLLRWQNGKAAPQCRMMWIEADDRPRAASLPFTNIHVCVDTLYGQDGPRAPAGGFDGHVASLLLREMTEAGALSPSQLTLLEHCMQALPPQAHLIHVSSMAGRSPVETKIYVALPRAALADCVARLAGPDWSARLDVLEPWTDAEANGSTLYCDVTFRGGACESVGLVFSRPQVAETGGDFGRALIRRRLIQEGLCTLAQNAALDAWAAHPLDPVCAFDPGMRMQRWLDIKVTATRNRLVSKAYLGFSPRVSWF